MQKYIKLLLGGLGLFARTTSSIQNPIMTNQTLPLKSVCLINSNFHNKLEITDPKQIASFEFFNTIASTILRGQRSQTALDLIKEVSEMNALLNQVQSTVFKENDSFRSLRAYIELIQVAVAQGKAYRETGIGLCGEATSASICNTLLRQLKSGDRATVQRVTIYSKSAQLNHGFVVYNSKPLISSMESTNQKIAQMLSEAKAVNKDMVELCDEHSNYHGEASSWAKKFFSARNQFARAEYDSIDIIDYSLPPLHKHFNDKQRDWIKNLLTQLLSQVGMVNEAEHYKEIAFNLLG